MSSTDTSLLMNYTVLCVEDDRDTRQQLAELLRRVCRRVETACDGLDGLNKYRTLRPDIIVSDIQMPNLDGLAMAKTIREINRSIPIVMLTAYDQSGFLIDAINAGIDKYVTKPLNLDQLMHSLGECARRLTLEEVYARHEAAERNKRHQAELGKISAAHLEAERQLIKSEQRLDLAMQCARMAYWELESKTGIFTLNDAFYTLLGTTAKESGGYALPIKRFTELFIAPEVHEDLIEKFKKTFHRNGGKTGRLDIEVKTPAGITRQMSLWGKTELNSGGKPHNIFGIIQDISELQQAYEAHHKLEYQLFQSQKLESIGQLAGGIAHDFNNKLTVILGCVELAEAVTGTPKKTGRYLEEIAGAARHSRDIISQLLAFSRRQLITPRVIDINSVLQNSIASLQHLIEEHISITFTPNREALPTLIDPVQLDQIVMNLAINSRDAMPEGGKLTISTGSITCDQPMTVTTGTIHGSYVSITVSDNGYGMYPDEIPKIFEPFYTTKEVGRGTGLGLATVHGIVTQNKGAISVTSIPEQGSCVTVYLPLTVPELPKQSTNDNNATAVTGSVLLVEDDAAVRNTIAIMLDNLGLNIATCASAEAAISLCRESLPSFDLVITDVILTGMTGTQLAEILTGLGCARCVLFMSGYATDITHGNQLVSENLGFLQKPVTAQQLRSAVTRLLSIKPQQEQPE